MNKFLTAVTPIGPGGSNDDKIVNPILGNLNNKSGASFISSFIPKVITIAFIVGVLVFFFNLIAGAIAWISSGGDKQALEGARGRITNAIIGLVIMFSIFAVVKIIEKFFGISILTLDIGKLVIR